MNLARGGLAAAGAGLAGAAAIAKLATSRRLDGVPGDAAPRNRWLTVTVNCPPDRFPAPAELPRPVARLMDQAEVSIRPAPGGRGTELAMRLFEQPPGGIAGLAARLTGEDPRQRVRTALRDAKSLIETGEVIEPDEPTTHDTLAGKLIGLATSRAGGEGRL